MGRLAVMALVAVLALTVAGAASAQDGSEDEPAYPSAAWTEREARNYARTQQAPEDQQSDAAFQERWQTQSQENFLEYEMRRFDDPDWDSSRNLCATWAQQCTGDPYRYPAVDPFYDQEAVVEPVVFVDRGGARLSGRVWAPIDAPTDRSLPGVVIINGSVQAPETLYWWAAQALVRSGYVVMTFDPRGQGRSDSQTPDGEQGSNANSDVFATNLIDAIDFFRSTPDAPYPPNQGDDRRTTPHNPLWDRIDPTRLGAAGHSLGATGVSVVQGIPEWPGSTGEGSSGLGNPIDAIVAWDNLALGTSLAGYELVPRVPAMGQSADYFLTPTPYGEPPDPDDKRLGYLAWVAAGLPAYQLNIEGGTHYEWSLLPTFPATAWLPGGTGGWGNPLAHHFTLAWFDRWLKQPGEPGYDTADGRLLAEDEVPGHDDLQAGETTATWRERLSFYFLSSRHFPDRAGIQHVCEDIEAGCTSGQALDGSQPEPAPDDPDDGSSLPATGGGLAAVGLVLSLVVARRRS